VTASWSIRDELPNARIDGLMSYLPRVRLPFHFGDLVSHADVDIERAINLVQADGVSFCP
jgi:hypothetical protein